MAGILTGGKVDSTVLWCPQVTQPMKDGVRDMLVKHHLFSWDLWWVSFSEWAVNKQGLRRSARWTPREHVEAQLIMLFNHVGCRILLRSTHLLSRPVGFHNIHKKSHLRNTCQFFLSWILSFVYFTIKRIARTFLDVCLLRALLVRTWCNQNEEVSRLAGWHVSANSLCKTLCHKNYLSF